MALFEPIRVPVGYDLVVEGLDELTQRDPGRSGGWGGLGASDVALLRRWVDGLGGKLRKLHTEVPVGLVPVVADGAENDFVRRQVEALHPLRIDACVELDDGWRVCEVKPDAGYVSLGQVLTYQYFACRTCECLCESVPVVLTDQVQVGIRPVFEKYGVEVVEVGGGLASFDAGRGR